MLPRTLLYCTKKSPGIHAFIRRRGQGSLDPPENRRNIVLPWSSEESKSCQLSIQCWAIIGLPANSNGVSLVAQCRHANSVPYQKK